VTLRTDGNVSHGGIGIDGACPCYGDDVFLLHIAAGYHNGRDGVQYGARFPDLFFHGSPPFFAKSFLTLFMIYDHGIFVKTKKRRKGV